MVAPRPARLGAVPYLNVAPLIHGLPGDPLFEVEQAVPAVLAERLHAGRLDVASLPSVEYARGDYRIVPGIALASADEVASVNLFHRGDLHRVRTLALDVSSRTSVALLRVLLAEWGLTPTFVTRPPDVEGMLREADAALVIGDPSLDYEGDAARLDLGAAWRRLTGLPFVWAFWAARPHLLQPAHLARLERARDEGLLAIPRIAREAAARGAGAVPPSEAGIARRERYLRVNMGFGLGEAEQAGLREFYRRAALLGLIDGIPDLRFADG